MNRKVLITGVGGVGVHAAHLLARIPGVELYLGDVRAQYIQSKANCIKDCAFQEGGLTQYPSVHPVTMNLLDLEQTTSQLRDIRPDVILHLATLLGAQRIRTSVPPGLVTKLYDANPVGTGMRPWAPGHAVLLANVMKAVRASGIDAHVVNASGCDYLHKALHNIDPALAPTSGLGDFGLLEPALSRIIAEKMDCHPRDIKLFLAAHHSIVMPLMFSGKTHGVPCYIKAELFGENITDRLDFESDIFPELSVHNSWPADAGAADQEQTSAHAVRIVRAILFDTQEMMNVQGPEGLPGCYPCRVGADGVRVVPPTGTSREALIRINEAGNLAEGFQEIREDGTMVATERTIELVEEIFGITWQYREFRPDQGMEAFTEIREALDNLIARYRSAAPEQRLPAQARNDPSAARSILSCYPAGLGRL